MSALTHSPPLRSAMEFIVKNFLLVAVAVVSGAMLLWPSFKRGSGGSRVDTLAATRLMNADAVVLDLREPAQYQAGHILGARNTPLAGLEKSATDLSRFKNRAVIVYCADGRRAGRALDVLRRAGFSQASQLDGGFAAWQQAGLPVEH
jgi:rhodanese-related sulfurtransferase